MKGTCQENAQLSWDALQEALSVELKKRNLPPLEEGLHELIKMNFIQGYGLGWEAAPKPKWVEMEEAAELTKSGWIVSKYDSKSGKYTLCLMCPPIPILEDKENEG